MVSSRLAFATLAAALLGGATADLTIITPGGSSLWWVDQSINTLEWSCTQNTQYASFNVLIANTNVNVLATPLTIIPTLDNFTCSKTISQDLFNLPASTGYTIELSNIFNNSDIYATSQPFEIKPFGSSYPDPSSTPTGGSSSSAGPSGTSSGSGSTPSSSSSPKSSDGVKIAFSGFATFVALAFGVILA